MEIDESVVTLLKSLDAEGDGIVLSEVKEKLPGLSDQEIAAHAGEPLDRDSAMRQIDSLIKLYKGDTLVLYVLEEMDKQP